MLGIMAAQSILAPELIAGCMDHCQDTWSIMQTSEVISWRPGPFPETNYPDSKVDIQKLQLKFWTPGSILEQSLPLATHVNTSPYVCLRTLVSKYSFSCASVKIIYKMVHCVKV